jgi:hypothetical protein
MSRTCVELFKYFLVSKHEIGLNWFQFYLGIVEWVCFLCYGGKEGGVDGVEQKQEKLNK